MLEAIQRFRTQTEAAKAIGINPSRFNTVLQSQADKGQSFEVGTCLRLARALGRSPGEVLIAAGKAEEHALIQKLYGEEKPVPALLHDERQALSLIRQEEGADDLFQAISEDSAISAVRSYSRVLGRLGTMLLTRVEELHRKEMAAREPDVLHYRAGDARSYWMWLEDLADSLQRKLLEASKEGRSEETIHDLRLRLRDASQSLAAARDASGSLLDSSQIPPEIHEVKRLADSTLESGDKARERERAELVRRLGAKSSNASAVDRVRRLERLLYHARLDLRDAKGGQSDREIDDCRQKVERLLLEIDEVLLPRPEIEGPKHEGLLTDFQRNELEEESRLKGREIRALRDEFNAIATSEDSQVGARLRDLALRIAALESVANERAERLALDRRAEEYARRAERRRSEEAPYAKPTASARKGDVRTR